MFFVLLVLLTLLACDIIIEWLSGNRLRREFLFGIRIRFIVNDDASFAAFGFLDWVINVLTLIRMSTWLSVMNTCRRVVLFSRGRLGGSWQALLWALNLAHIVLVWDEAETATTALWLGISCNFTLFIYWNVVHGRLFWLFLNSIFAHSNIMNFILCLNRLFDSLLVFATCTLASRLRGLFLHLLFVSWFVALTSIFATAYTLGFMRALLTIRFASWWAATGTILLIRSLIELEHWELGLVESCVHGDFIVIDILNLDNRSLTALSSVCEHLRNTKDALAEGALANRVGALDWLVTNLVLFEDASSAALTSNVHKVAIVKLVSSK